MKQKFFSPIDSLNGQLMVMAAHRYSLGRRSYIVGSCIEWLKEWWPNFESNTRKIIFRDTIEALQDNLAGEAMDKENWKSFAEWTWEKLDAKERLWCQSSINQRGKDWPIKIN